MEEDIFRREVCQSLIQIENLLERLVNNKAPKPVVPRAAMPEFPKEFEEFWRAYPAVKRKNKMSALLEWKRCVAPQDVPSVMSALAEQSKSAGWAKDGGRYIQLPQNWLRDHKWLDGKEDRNDGLGKYGGVGEVI